MKLDSLKNARNLARSTPSQSLSPPSVTRGTTGWAKLHSRNFETNSINMNDNQNPGSPRSGWGDATSEQIRIVISFLAGRGCVTSKQMAAAGLADALGLKERYS